MSVSSHEEKMLSLQHQMRQNQSELQSYLAGLDDWQSEIKEKEKKLKSSESDKVWGGKLTSSEHSPTVDLGCNEVKSSGLKFRYN